MTDKNIADQVREETRAQLEEALEGLDPSILKAQSAEHFRAIVNAETDEEREAAIADAVLAGESELIIRAAANGSPIIDLDSDEGLGAFEKEEDDEEGDSFAYQDVPTQGKVTLSMVMTINDPSSLGFALDSFNASLGRFGTDGFYVIARDESGQEWAINGGRVMNMDELDDDE